MLYNFVIVYKISECFVDIRRIKIKVFSTQLIYKQYCHSSKFQTDFFSLRFDNNDALIIFKYNKSQFVL